MARISFFVTLVFLFCFKLGLLQCYNLKLQKPNISPECELVGICDSVENYPTEVVKGLIDKLKSQNMIFNYEEAPLSSTTYRTNKYDIHQRVGISYSHEVNIEKAPQPILMIENIYNNEIYKIKPAMETNYNLYYKGHSFRNKKTNKKPLSLCETKTQFIKPKTAKDMNGKWQFIINDSEEPVQVFRIETCRTPMDRCSENIGFLPGYDGACIQKMALREMYYVNETEEIDKTYFPVPTCCSCVLLRKHDDD